MKKAEYDVTDVYKLDALLIGWVAWTWIQFGEDTRQDKTLHFDPQKHFLFGCGVDVYIYIYIALL